MKVTEAPLPDVKVIEPSVFGDERGFFLEVWNAVGVVAYLAYGVRKSRLAPAPL